MLVNDKLLYVHSGLFTVILVTYIFSHQNVSVKLSISIVSFLFVLYYSLV